MPERLFDAEKFLARRRALKRKQPDVGVAVGSSANSVSRWETKAAVPPQEKLPALAEFVELTLDELAPRPGLPDLKDLRCDAGLQQKDTARITKTSSAMPVRAAEGKLRRLKEEFVPLLAQAYGVSVEEVLAAQERTFGNQVPDVRRQQAPRPVASGTPQTVAEKISYLLDNTYAPHQRPTDAELADRGNEKVGRVVLDEALVRALRAGDKTTDEQEVLAALAAALDAPPVFFASESPQEAARIVASIRTVQNDLSVMAARGGGDGALPAEWLDFITESFKQITGGQPDGSADEER